MSTEKRTNEERCQDLLIDYGFNNDIEILPPAGDKLPFETYKALHYTHKSALQAKEEEKTRKKNEAEFRSWLIKNKPEQSVLVAVETNTAVGIPDLFGCYSGHNFWFECKSLVTPRPGYLRGTQYAFFKKLAQAGGFGKVVIQYLEARSGQYKPATIHLYDIKNIVCQPIDFFSQKGERLHFPRTLKPNYVWKYDKLKSEPIEYFYQRLFLDSDDFIW